MDIKGKISDLFKKENVTEEEKLAREWEKSTGKKIDEFNKENAKRAERERKRNECRGMLEQCERHFKNVISQEVRNAKYAKNNNIDYSLNRAHVSDAMSGLDMIKKARWSLNTMQTDEGLQKALVSLNRALGIMNHLDFTTPGVNGATLRRRVKALNAQEHVNIEDEMVLEPGDNYIYKLDNGLFENMMNGMSYEEAAAAARQDQGTSRYTAQAGGTDFSSMFREEASSASSDMEKILKDRSDRLE